MKKLSVIILLIISLSGFSQQLIRGYTASFAYGFLSKGDDFNIYYGGSDYTASARSTNGSCISLGFPFDYGYNRSRLVVTPGLDFLTANYELDLDNDIPLFGSDSDSLKLSSFMLVPQIGLMYKYHFYVKGLHFSLGAGLDFRLPISNSITLTTKNKADLIEYDKTPSTIDYMTFTPKTVYSNMAELGFHVSPRIGFDIYITKFLATNIYYTVSPLTTYTNSPAIRGYGGFGISYLIPLGKEDDSRLLQYYKQ
jgi:hypothetical protein